MRLDFKSPLTSKPMLCSFGHVASSYKSDGVGFVGIERCDAAQQATLRPRANMTIYLASSSGMISVDLAKLPHHP
jgi:hypothetical protein